MARKVAIKRLSAVEIDPDQSHQHEFHAGGLRRELGFGDDRTSGYLHLEIHRRDGSVVRDDSPFTLYDAREAHPTRSEWHLYYASKALPQLASPGDLLVLWRPDDGHDLAGIVAADASPLEGQLRTLIARGRVIDVGAFQIVEAQPSPSVAAAAIDTLFADDDFVSTIPSGPTDHSIADAASRSGRVPSSTDMARAAGDMVRGRVDPLAEPDAWLAEILAAETRLFYEVERAAHEARLHEIIAAGGSVSEVLSWAMGIHQARRSRRGLSLQIHFSGLLEVREVPFTAQCTTEPGETPDFVLPSCTSYHDPSFPASRLRMVACKSTSKERWRQILNEAARIAPKYLLTLDTALTPSTVAQMVAAGLRPHLPRSIIAGTYAGGPSEASLGDVAALLDQLEAARV